MLPEYDPRSADSFYSVMSIYLYTTKLQVPMVNPQAIYFKFLNMDLAGHFTDYPLQRMNFISHALSITFSHQQYPQ